MLRMPPEVFVKDSTVEGGWRAKLPTVKRSIAQYASLDDVKRFYIGKASGPDAEFALVRRDDDRKIDHGINEMVALYQSHSEDFAYRMEHELIEYFLDHPKCVNAGPGAEGAPSRQPWQYVYIAMRRWGGSWRAAYE